MVDNRHFVAIVAGEKPSELMKPFSNNIKVDPYTVYKASDAGKYKEKYLSVLKHLIDNDKTESIELLFEYDRVKNLEDIDYYLEFTEDYENYRDETTGDIVLTKNPMGMYDWCRLGKELCLPLIDKNGNEVFQARKKDINWEKIHGYNTWTYETVWDLVMGGKKPEGDVEKNLYENMKNRVNYFNFFGTKENYVKNNTSFWGYAFVDENGWKELEDNMSQIDWVNNFYDTFIKLLPDDTLISVYECFREKTK